MLHQIETLKVKTSSINKTLNKDWPECIFERLKDLAGAKYDTSPVPCSLTRLPGNTINAEEGGKG